MALRNIVQTGDPILCKVCRPVAKFDDKLAQLLEDMGETLIEARGLGLAGPQVGVLRRVFIALDERDAEEETAEDMEAAEEAGIAEELEPEEELEDEELEDEEPPVILEFINPEILSREGEVEDYEGCLSFPGRFAAIKRPEKVTVRAFDRHGTEFTLEAEGMLARCLCHEINHLDGVTIEDLAEYFYDPENPKKLGEGTIDEEIDGDEA